MSAKRRKQWRKCLGGCGRTVQNFGGVCASCLDTPGKAPGMRERVGADCLWCGRVHVNHLACEMRADKAAETVRLWLYEGVRPGAAAEVAP